MYKQLLNELFELENDLEIIVSSLQKIENTVKESYRTKYVDLIFEFYSSGYNFLQITEEVCDINNDEDISELMNDFDKFICSYARLLQFFTFAALEEPDNLWIIFNYWKNKRLDIIELNK